MKLKLFFISFASLIFICNIAFAQNADYLKTEIYSKLRDSRCSTMALDKCNCPSAREMKAYIEALHETGQSKEEIFYKVARKFSLNTILDPQMKSQLEQRFIKEAGDKRPQLVLDSNTFDFGKISKKSEKATKVFKIVNKGNVDLIVNNIRATCGCTSASLKVGKNKSPYFKVAGAPSDWQSIIKPNKSAELEVVLDLMDRSMSIGKQSRDILISSNDPIYPQASVKVVVDVTD